LVAYPYQLGNSIDTKAPDSHLPAEEGLPVDYAILCNDWVVGDRSKRRCVGSEDLEAEMTVMETRVSGPVNAGCASTTAQRVKSLSLLTSMNPYKNAVGVC
jgi:hypothetical protein